MLVLGFVDGGYADMIKTNQNSLALKLQEGNRLGGFLKRFEDFKFSFFKIKIGKFHVNKKLQGFILYKLAKFQNTGINNKEVQNFCGRPLLLSDISAAIMKPYSIFRGRLDVFLFILFMSAGAIVWYTESFAAVLLHYVFPKMTSMLVLFVIFKNYRKQDTYVKCSKNIFILAIAQIKRCHIVPEPISCKTYILYCCVKRLHNNCTDLP